VLVFYFCVFCFPLHAYERLNGAPGSAISIKATNATVLIVLSVVEKLHPYEFQAHKLKFYHYDAQWRANQRWFSSHITPLHLTQTPHHFLGLQQTNFNLNLFWIELL